jgi:hypothetical protein
MSLLVILYSAILFFILSPGVLLRLPKNGDKFTVAGVHAVVFALIFGLTYKFVWKMGARLRLEGMDTMGSSIGATAKNIVGQNK